MEQGYPAGTKCVITWTNSRGLANGIRIGQEVTTGEITMPLDDGLLGQEVDLPAPDGFSVTLYPAEWMRPLSDPDAEPIQTEQREELTA